MLVRSPARLQRRTGAVAAVLLLALVCLAGLGGIGSRIAGAVVLNPGWGVRASMPTPRQAFGFAGATNGKLYAAGGTNASGLLASVDEYDPLNDTWRSRSRLPSARSHFGMAASSNGKLYAIGGWTGSNLLTTVEEYDPVTDVWTSRASMPTARSGLGVVAASNGKLYAVGGSGLSSAALQTVEEYDPATDTWSTRAPMPSARYALGLAAASNGKLYAAGGQNAGTATLSRVEEYDPVTNTWTSKNDMLFGRSAFGLAGVANGRVYAFSGTTNTNTQSTLEEYDPATDSWRPMAGSGSNGRWWLGFAAASNGRLYAAGGGTAFPVLSNLDELDPSGVTTATPTPTPTLTRTPTATLTRTPTTPSPGWRARANMLTARSELGVAASNGKIYAVGGMTSANVILTTLEEYDPTTDSWIARASMPTARRGLGFAAAANGKLYAVGGMTPGASGGSFSTTAIVEEYDPATNTWTTRASMPTARYWLGLAAAPNGKLYAIGGTASNGGSAAVEEYDPASNTWSTRASMPTSRSALGLSVTATGRLLAMGGYPFGCCSSPVSSVEEFDPATNTWTARPSLLAARAFFGAATTAAGLVIAVGGIGNSSYGNPPDGARVEVFNPTTSVWSVFSSLPTARSQLGIALSNGKIYAVGGNDGGALSVVEELDPAAGVTATATRTGTPTATATPTMTPTPPIASAGWTTRASMPTARMAFGLVTAANGRLYAVGGTTNLFYSNAGPLATVEEYDPLAQVWSARSSMPTARWGLGLATATNGKVYAVGGIPANSSTATNKVEEYDPTTDTWTTRASMGQSRAHLGLVAGTNGRLYAIGGSTSISTSYESVATVEEYDPAANRWTTKAGLLIERAELAVVAAGNGRIYAIGGVSSGGRIPGSIEEFDPATNIWTAKANTSLAKPNPAAALGANGKIYVVGGYAWTGLSYSTGTVDEYDPLTDRWSRFSSMPVARGYLGMATASNGKTYAVGGYDGRALAIVDEFDPSQATTATPTVTVTRTPTITLTATATAARPSTGWSARASMPIARRALGVAASTSGKIYAVGGSTTSSYESSATASAALEEYDVASNAWATRAAMPTARFGLGAVVAANGKLYAMGGSPSTTVYSNPPILTTVEEYDPATDAWTRRAEMPTGRASFGLVEVSGKLYAIGGRVARLSGSSTPDRTVEAYDPATDTWTPRASMVSTRQQFSTAVLDGKIYAVGGYGTTASSSFALLSSVEVYDPSTNEWSAQANLPTARVDHGLAAAAGNLYAVGGSFGSYSSTSRVDRYDPATNRWTVMAGLPTARQELGVAAASNGRIYAIGGFDGRLLPTVEEMDPVAVAPATATSTITATATVTPTSTATPVSVSSGWTTRSSLPGPRSALGLTAGANDKLYAAGGSAPTQIVASVQEFDVATGTWIARAAMSAPRADFPLVTASNGRMYAIGGNGGFGSYPQALETVEEYDPATNAWTVVASMAYFRYSPGAAAYNGKVYAAGGWGGVVASGTGDILASVEEYDPVTNTWTTRASMAVPRAGLGLVAPGNGRLYAVGGYRYLGSMIQPLATVEEYDPTMNTWSTRASLPTARMQAGVAAVNGKVYAIGGYGMDGRYLNTVEEYDPATNTWTTRPSMPTSRSRLGLAVATNGKLYAVGGTDGQVLAAVEEFDPVLAVTTATPTVPAALTTTPTATLTVTSTAGLTATLTVTSTAGLTATQTATPVAPLVATPTPTTTALVSPPNGVATVAVTPLATLPIGIPTINAATGGMTVALPTVAADSRAVAVLQSNGSAPFAMTLMVPVPVAGQTPIALRVQPSTALDAGVAIPPGVTITKVVAIDVFDPATGALIHDHSRPLELTLQLTSDEQAICRIDPGRIAVLHVAADGKMTRLAPTRLDCDTGILNARLFQTSAFALATLDNSFALTMRLLLPTAPQKAAGW